ncbi:MAG: oligosaccharide flippase family protein, partial [Chloroflexi bacterium]|nr:oligosaccharide flippase family protein [Chloroflexota bacterium]
HSVEHVRGNRELRHDTEWGGKNYVEGTVYLGVLPLLLAPIGLLAHPRGARLALGLLALLVTLFAFGTPLYALLFYGVPGVNQLHTPFRWVYPLSVCVAVLAGLGAGALARPRQPGRDAGRADTSIEWRARAEARWGIRIGVAAVSIGLALVAALLTLLLFPDAATALAARLLARSPDLRAGFGEARVLFSYQYANLLGSALLLAASGLALVVGARRRSLLAGALALGLLVGDLFSFGIGFNGVAETDPLDLTPRSIQALQADPTVFRIVTFGEDDTLPSNTNMLFGLQDIRGYDTIILREYVEYLELIEPQRGIAYSKVAKLFDERSLASPLLDLLNVKYVLTSKTVRQPGYTLVYEGEGIRVYRNERALPRAFVVASAVPASDHAEALASVGDPAFDPRRRVVLEGWNGSASSASPDRVAERPAQTAEIVAYEGNRVVVQASAPEGGFLVLGDVFFDGWTVSVDGVAQPLLRANALFRAVELGPGLHQVVFEYRPFSFRLGALVSALATVGLMLLCGLVARGRLHAPVGQSTVAQRVFRNAAFPMATSLLNKALDVGFALVMFRVLQAEGVGAYTFAGVLIGYFDILVNFGLGTLTTREVARDHAAAARYLGNSIVIRLVLWLVSGGAVGFLAGPGAEPLGITPPIALTIWLLWLALLPGILSGGLSALFMAHERMTSPAIVTVVTTLLKVSLGLIALAGGWGYVGLAAVALVTNTITALILLGHYAATLGLPGLVIDWSFSRSMAIIAFPLMVNNLLNSVFFRIDALLLKPLAGDVALGWYSTAYKFIDGLQIIPSSFVLALFPLLSRYATADRERLAQLTGLSLKTLLTIALPISVGTTLLAEPIILVFAGASYLPESARALQVLIWFLPLSFVNGLLQYVLISIGREGWITRGFLLGASVNLLANLALIPAYGYLAASAVTVASELVLLAPFWRVIRRELPPIDLLGLAWRPAVAALAMAGPVWLLSGWSALLAIPSGAVVYGAVLLVLGGLDAADRATLRGLLRR